MISAVLFIGNQKIPNERGYALDPQCRYYGHPGTGA
jgi:hypothetical protein